MPKRPEQSPVILQKSGEGAFTSVTGFTLPPPPDDCESQQLMDWGSVTSIVMASHVNLALKLRMVEAYTARWDVSTVDEDKE